nr:hypothetical protein [Sicyoidochytrium minutum DNA virus]
MSAETEADGENDPCPSLYLRKHDSVLVLVLPEWAQTFLPQIMAIREKMKDWPYRMAKFDLSHRLYEKVCVDVVLWEPAEPDSKMEQYVNAWKRSRHEKVRSGLVEPVTNADRQYRYIWSRREEVIAKHGERCWVYCVGDVRADEAYWKLAAFDTLDEAFEFGESLDKNNDGPRLNAVSTVSDAFRDEYFDDSWADKYIER